MKIKNKTTGDIVDNVSEAAGYNRSAGWLFVDREIKDGTVKLYGEKWEEVKEYVELRFEKSDYEQMNTIGHSLAVLGKDGQYHVVPYAEKI